MKKPKIGLPPVPQSSVSMHEMINKGGSVSERESPHVEREDNKLKSFTFKIYESELAQIRAIRDKSPARDRISIHDFVVDAVKFKIAQENQKHN